MVELLIVQQSLFCFIQHRHTYSTISTTSPSDRMKAMPGTWYFHRTSDNSYWMRESRYPEKMSLTTLQVVLPYIDLFKPRDAAYILSHKGRREWFQKRKYRPIRLHL